MTLVDTQDDVRPAPARNGKATHDATSQIYPLTRDLKRRAQAVAAVAATHAATVDAEARFPNEAFSLLTTPTLRYAYIQPNPPRSYDMAGILTSTTTTSRPDFRHAVELRFHFPCPRVTGNSPAQQRAAGRDLLHMGQNY